jgi:vacuolar-type H+-ATPase subunit F/Vma7|tara:strand:- start:6047 stop:6565 length:519 start_codon:yes stop_codon:yes gene_type:complete
MKKIIIVVAFLIASSASYAQSFFDTLEDMEGVDVVVVTKDAFEMLSKFQDIKIDGNQTMKVFSLINDLQELKIFTTNDANNANKMDKMVSKAIKVQKLTELMRVKEEDTRMKIYVKTTKNKSYVSEVLMFIKGVGKKTNKNIESVIISLTGNIDVQKISEITDTLVKEANRK